MPPFWVPSSLLEAPHTSEIQGSRVNLYHGAPSSKEHLHFKACAPCCGRSAYTFNGHISASCVMGTVIGSRDRTEQAFLFSRRLVGKTLPGSASLAVRVQAWGVTAVRECVGLKGGLGKAGRQSTPKVRSREFLPHLGCWNTSWDTRDLSSSGDMWAANVGWPCLTVQLQDSLMLREAGGCALHMQGGAPPGEGLTQGGCGRRSWEEMDGEWYVANLCFGTREAAHVSRGHQWPGACWFVHLCVCSYRKPYSRNGIQSLAPFMLA